MTTKKNHGHPLAPGRAAGVIYAPGLRRSRDLEPTTKSTAADGENRRFQEQVTELLDKLRARADRLEERDLPEESHIVRAHAALLGDKVFHEKVHDAISELELTAEEAAERTLEEAAQALASSDNEVLRERAADFRDLAQQLQQRLSGEGPDLRVRLAELEGAIIVCDEFLPSMVLEGWEGGAGGFVVSQGTELSHAAIIAQSVGLPVVRLACLDPLKEQEGKRTLVDGDAGLVVLSPSGDQVEALSRAGDDERWHEMDLPAELSLSIMAPRQLVGQDWRGVRGVGLYRTEMLFLEQSERFPSEEEQRTVYEQLLDLCGDHDVVIRTADLGADKPLKHMYFGPEANPYLGLRAHRLFYYHPEILVTQLRAILRAAAGRHVRLMFPMLETVDQWEFVQSLVARAIESLGPAGRRLAEPMEVGVLIETPAAVWSFADLMKEVDFASVGTNDLVQYMFAAERDAPNVASFYQPEHPVMLRILRQLVEQADAAGKELGICGEIASEPRYVPLLVGLGFRHLTVSGAQVDRVGRTLAGLDPDECRKLAEDCLSAGSAADVRTALRLPDEEEEVAEAESNRAVDPVCGMIVPKHGEFSAEHEGVRYHFCSERCLQQFEDTDT